MKTAGFAALCLTLAAPASAEVVAASSVGLTSRNVATVTATPAETWAALVSPSFYWNSEHSWSGNSANLTLDPKAGGCFCEELPASGGSVQHMRVIYADPGAQLRMSGALGPLQSEALTGTLTVKLTPVDGGTRIEWTYLVGGYASFDLVQLAPVVDGVMAEQLAGLAVLLGPVGAPEEARRVTIPCFDRRAGLGYIPRQADCSAAERKACFCAHPGVDGDPESP